ncbi:hypothetical protein EV359DRAFT_63797 [Lentinula novae-zelandiae]|nr:hypothetical protein EV359DRAFT_63797 [Lentinula novae-zelandiae]
MPKLPAAVLVAFFVIAVHASPMRILARQDELMHHYPVARQYMQSGYGGGGYDPTGGGGGYGGGYDSSNLGGYGVPGNGGFNPNTDPNAPIDKKTALIQAGTGAVVSTVGALATTGALPVMIKGTKKAVNKTVQTVNSTYHHTKEKVHNVTTHIFHPFRNKQEEKKTDMDGHKDEAHLLTLTSRIAILENLDLITKGGMLFRATPKLILLHLQRHHWEITDSDWEMGVSPDDSRVDYSE